MRILLQRVTRARVTVQAEVIGSIGQGLLALVGIAHGDDASTCTAMAQKCIGLRIFEDEAGLMNRDILTVGGAILAVSQFTLFADCRKGRRPYFGGAARGDSAQELFELFVSRLRQHGVTCETGVFGAPMQVELVNDGPVSIWLDSLELARPRRAATTLCSTRSSDDS